MGKLAVFLLVSTHSRPKAAGEISNFFSLYGLFQHTAARRRLNPFFRQIQTHCSFNTQPPEGGWYPWFSIIKYEEFQHTAARRRLMRERRVEWELDWFQHTAARRRLIPLFNKFQ